MTTAGMRLVSEGWMFQLARKGRDEASYDNWGMDQFSFTEPHVPKGSIRYLRKVYSVVHDSEWSNDMALPHGG